MLDTVENSVAPNNQAAAEHKSKKILRMIKNERMGGYVPKWESPQTPKEQIAFKLEMAGIDDRNTGAGLAYTGTENYQSTQEEFGFGDLVDMINPLQHVPVVSHLYREITGDDIKPISQIVGGAVFGGPLGAANGLANTISKEETGKDMAGNAIAMAKSVMDEPEPDINIANNAPEQIIETAANTNEYDDLPGNLLSFVDLKSNNDTIIKRIENAHYPEIEKASREPISTIQLSGLYALAEE